MKMTTLKEVHITTLTTIARALRKEAAGQFNVKDETKFDLMADALEVISASMKRSK